MPFIDGPQQMHHSEESEKYAGGNEIRFHRFQPTDAFCFRQECDDDV